MAVVGGRMSNQLWQWLEEGCRKPVLAVWSAPGLAPCHWSRQRLCSSFRNGKPLDKANPRNTKSGTLSLVKAKTLLLFPEWKAFRQSEPEEHTSQLWQWLEEGCRKPVLASLAPCHWSRQRLCSSFRNRKPLDKANPRNTVA